MRVISAQEVAGTGKLAPMLIEAHATVRPIRKVRIWGRNPDKSAALAERFRDRFDCEAVTGLKTAVTEADITSCATLSTEPLIRGEWLQGASLEDLAAAIEVWETLERKE